MQPVKRTITGAASLVIPLNTYGEVGVSWYADQSVTVSPLADKDDSSSQIGTPVAAASGSFGYPCDALLVTTTATTNVIVNQYGD